jgi:hypothetical protein
MLELVIAAALVGDPAFEASAIPKAKADIAAACGVSPPVSVAWADFGEDKDGASALVASGIGFVGAAFARVCKDPALKAEVRKQIQKVVLRQAYGATEPILYISRGTLFIEYLWVKGDPVPDAAFVGAELADRLRGGEPAAD